MMAAVGALALSGCGPEAHPAALAGQMRGASVAFDSIDGPPPGQFRQLVQDLNSEAQTRQLAVISRENPSAYRVRGYLAANVMKKQTTISWVWDVFDENDRRALRISGEETAKGRHHAAWDAADDEILRRIAHSSMDKLAEFLTSPAVAPGTPDSAGEPQMARAGMQDSTPEAAGIYRISHPNADPAEGEIAQPSAGAHPVPLPRRRPMPVTVVSALETLTLAASSR